MYYVCKNIDSCRVHYNNKLCCLYLQLIIPCKQLSLYDLSNARFWNLEYIAKNEQKCSDLFLFMQYITCQWKHVFIVSKKDICTVNCVFKIV